MKKRDFNLFCVLGLVAISMIVTQGAEAVTNIPNGVTILSPPQANDNILFQSPEPGGTLAVQFGHTFVGNIDTQAPNVGTLELIGSLDGSVGLTHPIRNINAISSSMITGSAATQSIIVIDVNLLVQNGLTLPANSMITINLSPGPGITVTGANTFVGPLVLTYLNLSGILKEGIYPIIDAQSGTTDAADQIKLMGFPAMYTYTPLNSNGSVSLKSTLHPKLGGAANVLSPLINIAASNPGSDIATVILALQSLPSTDAVIDAVLQFAPPVDGALTRMSFNSAKQFQQLWSLHMTNGRCVYAQCDEDYYLLDENGEYVNQDGITLREVQEECDSSVYCDSVLNRWEVWADGFGLWGHQNSKQGFNGYRAHLYGGMLAAQGPITQELSAGFGGGYAQTHVQRDHNNHSTIGAYNATVYLSYNPTHWYLDAAFSFDYNHYHDLRHIKFPGIDRTAKADYNGLQYTGLLAGGYRFYGWCAIFTPLASLQYSRLNVDNYHEHGAKDLDLHVKSQDYNFLESSLGLKIARPIQTDNGAIIPEVHALWLYDFYHDAMHLKGNLSGAAKEGTFIANGPGMARNRGDVGVGITFITCYDLGLEFVYNYEFSKRWHASEGLIKISQRF